MKVWIILGFWAILIIISKVYKWKEKNQKEDSLEFWSKQLEINFPNAVRKDLISGERK